MDFRAGYRKRRLEKTGGRKRVDTPRMPLFAKGTFRIRFNPSFLSAHGE